MRIRQGFGPALLMSVLALGGCGTISHEKVEGWPKLTVLEHRVADAEVQARCARYVHFGLTPVACAEFDFARGACHIWYSADRPATLEVILHERLHCRGYDHPGDTAMRTSLERYRAARRATGHADVAATRS
jgi:hypothetical protein